MKTESFEVLVKRELNRARSLHPQPINSFHEGAAVLRDRKVLE